MSPEKKLLKPTPEAIVPATYRELIGSSYIVLADGSVARKLKPRMVGTSRFWFLSNAGSLRCVSQKTIDDMICFP